MDITAELTANVWKVLVEPGARVEAGDTLVILEAMKLEIPVVAEAAGTVNTVHVVEGSEVGEDAVLITLDTE